MVFTCPNDGWTGLCIKLCLNESGMESSVKHLTIIYLVANMSHVISDQQMPVHICYWTAPVTCGGFK